MNEKKIKNLKKVVEEMLEKYPATRNSDVFLTLTIWHQFYNDQLRQIDDKIFVDFYAIQFLPTESAIGRVRRKIQESGKFPPTSLAVAMERKWNEEEWRKAMGANPELRKV